MHSSWNKGISHTEEHKKKIGLGVKNSTKYKNAIKNPERNIKIGISNTGKVRTEEMRRRIGKAGVGKHVGEKNGMWKGGITKIDKLCRRMMEYRQWRSDVFQRDNWTCRTCGINKVYVTAHHINGLNKIIRENNIKNIIDARNCKEMWDINNGITLCEECHSLTDNYRGRSIKKIIK